MSESFSVYGEQMVVYINQNMMRVVLFPIDARMGAVCIRCCLAQKIPWY